MSIKRYNRFSYPEIDLQFLFESYHLSDWFRMFISSGTEVCHRHFLNDGIIRIDGKLIVASINNNGIIKISGVLEIDSDLE